MDDFVLSIRSYLGTYKLGTQILITAYVITQRPLTHPVLARCIKSLERYQWTWEIFPARDGHSVRSQDWSEISVEILRDRGKLQHRPGAQGCWLSHFALWQRAAGGETLIVLEHDVLAQAAFDPCLLESGELIKLYTSAKIKQNTITGRWSIGAHAYLLTPENAKRLIDHSRVHGAQALDKHLGDLVVPWRFWDRDLFKLDPYRGASTTSWRGSVR